MQPPLSVLHARGGVRLLPREGLLTFEEIRELVAIFTELGAAMTTTSGITRRSRSRSCCGRIRHRMSGCERLLVCDSFPSHRRTGAPWYRGAELRSRAA